MAAKTYKLEMNQTHWEMQVEIDEELIYPYGDNKTSTCKEAIITMVEFWANHKSLLEDNDGDYTKAFLKMLARECFLITVEKQYNLNGLIEEFEDREGWCNMDGSFGIKIIQADDFDPDYSDFEIES